MNRFSLVLGAWCSLFVCNDGSAGEQFGAKRTNIEIGKHQGFILEPQKPATDTGRPWIWYAPTIGAHPNKNNEWILKKLLDRGFYVCGINVGESYGSPAGRKIFSEFHDHVVRNYKLDTKARLLAQSRGGLMLYNWAAENPDKVQRIVGIYPVCDLRSYPGLSKAAGAYKLSPADLEKNLQEHNPIDRLEPLAKAGVPILHIHGDKDSVVPLEKNSQVLFDRYKALGGPMELIVVAGKGHAEIPEFFQDPRLVNFLATKAQKDAKEPQKKAGKSLKDRYPLPYPPRLPDGKTVVTESDAAFLKPGPNLRDGVEIARTAPLVDFAFYPEQNYPGNPWSHRSDGIVVGEIYYSSTNDHLAPRGTAHLWEYDARAKKFRLLCDTTKFLETQKAFPADMNYRPGEMQSRIDLGSDGWLYYATDRGSPTVTHDGNGYRGEWVLRTNPKTLETKIVSTFPIAKHTLPASVLDPKRMIYYGGTAPGKDAVNQKIQFFALDVKSGKLLKVADDGPYRTLIFSSSTGKVFWKGKSYDPATNEISDANVPDVRSATRETAQGIVYGTSGTKADLWAFNVKTGELKQLGSAAVAKQEYIASIEVDPTGRYLYYVPGAHGGAAGDGTPVVQYVLATGKRKVLAFLHAHFWEKYGYALDGSFGSALDENGERLFISWDGWRKGQPRGWESAALTVVHIPASERTIGKKEDKRRTGTLVGFVTDKGDIKNMNNAWVEIKADGEEKGRKYAPAADRKLGGPDREVLKAIRAVAIGARVQIEWIDAGDGKDISKFEVLRPAK